MHFGLTETQTSIKNSAREFFSAECPMSEVRRLMETDTAMDAPLWKKFAEHGWTGIVFPEQYDGFGLGLVEMAVAMEEMGRALVPGPFISTVLLAGTILEKAGSEEQKRKYLAAICRGEAKATLVSRDELYVSDAGAADFLIVARREQGELALFLIQNDAAGVTKTPVQGIDLTRRLYSVSINKIQGELLARGDKAEQALEAALDVARVGLCAEMVGGMQRLVDLTVEYAKTRKQFGKPIGTFQAVQHQCADMLFLLEGARSATYYAAWALSENDPGARVAVSVAKAYASEAYRDVGNRSIQVQGGMGFTWENDAHLYYRRAKGSEIAFGDATFHRERIAKALIDIG